jgi:hypothetical protein
MGNISSTATSRPCYSAAAWQRPPGYTAHDPALRRSVTEQRSSVRRGHRRAGILSSLKLAGARVPGPDQIADHCGLLPHRQHRQALLHGHCQSGDMPNCSPTAAWTLAASDGGAEAVFTDRPPWGVALHLHCPPRSSRHASHAVKPWCQSLPPLRAVRSHHMLDGFRSHQRGGLCPPGPTSPGRLCAPLLRFK